MAKATLNAVKDAAKQFVPDQIGRILGHKAGEFTYDALRTHLASPTFIKTAAKFARTPAEFASYFGNNVLTGPVLAKLSPRAATVLRTIAHTVAHMATPEFFDKLENMSDAELAGSWPKLWDDAERTVLHTGDATASGQPGEKELVTLTFGGRTYAYSSRNCPHYVATIQWLQQENKKSFLVRGQGANLTVQTLPSETRAADYAEGTTTLNEVLSARGSFQMCDGPCCLTLVDPLASSGGAGGSAFGALSWADRQKYVKVIGALTKACNDVDTAAREGRAVGHDLVWVEIFGTKKIRDIIEQIRYCQDAKILQLLINVEETNGDINLHQALGIAEQIGGHADPLTIAHQEVHDLLHKGQHWAEKAWAWLVEAFNEKESGDVLKSLSPSERKRLAEEWEMKNHGQTWNSLSDAEKEQEAAAVVWKKQAKRRAKAIRWLKLSVLLTVLGQVLYSVASLTSAGMGSGWWWGNGLRIGLMITSAVCTIPLILILRILQEAETIGVTALEYGKAITLALLHRFNFTPPTPNETESFDRGAVFKKAGAAVMSIVGLGVGLGLGTVMGERLTQAHGAFLAVRISIWVLIFLAAASTANLNVFKNVDAAGRDTAISQYKTRQWYLSFLLSKPALGIAVGFPLLLTVITLGFTPSAGRFTKGAMVSTDDGEHILMPDNRTRLPKGDVFGEATVHVCADKLVHADEWTELQPIEGWRFEGRWNTLPRAIETRDVIVTNPDPNNKQDAQLVLAKYGKSNLVINLIEFFPDTTQYDYDANHRMVVKKAEDGIRHLSFHTPIGWKVSVTNAGFVRLTREEK